MVFREIVLCGLVLAVSCVMPLAQATEGGHGAWAAGMTTDGLIARYSVSDKDAVFVGAAYDKFKEALNINGGNGSFTQDSYGVVIGYRHYLNRGDVRGFVNASLSNTYVKVTGSAASMVGYDKRKETSALLAYGVEKNISDSFSVEGAAGIEVSHTYGGGIDTTRYSLPVVEVGVGYYFK